MLLLRSKFERACLVVGIVGFTVFGIGLYGWYQDTDHSFMNYTNYIPDYPSDLFPYAGGYQKTSFVQHHRSCKWTNTAPTSDVFDPTGPIMVADELLSIEPKCMSSILGVERPTQEKFVSLNLQNLSLLGLSIPSYRNVLFGHAYVKSELSDEDINSGEGVDDRFYKNYVRREFRKARWPENISDQVFEKCLVVKKAWCVETQRQTYFYFLAIIKANTSLLIGVILLTAGFIGAFFLGVLKWAWHISLGKVLAWIKGE